MPCESQPGWYCLERVMRYRLNRQLILGQIASVIQNKHGWHASHKGWTVQSRGPVIRTETTGPEIHFAQYRRGDAQSGFHWSGCFILEEWDFVGIIYNLQVSHEYSSQHVFFFLSYCLQLLLWGCFIVYSTGEFRKDKHFHHSRQSFWYGDERVLILMVWSLEMRIYIQLTCLLLVLLRSLGRRLKSDRVLLV